MEKVGLRPCCGQPSDRGRLKEQNRTAQREGAYTRYKYRAKKYPNGVGIKTHLQSIPVVGPSKITRELLTKTTALLVDMHECTFQAV